MNFYEMTQEALQSPDMDTKATVCHQLLTYCNTNETIDQAEQTPVVFGTPSYASICHIVDPRELPSRKNFDTVQGLATLVHAIAHIEFSAVDLALDATYRFTDMPMEYKIDWLVVAEDEIRHFRMLCEILDDLDFAYGDLPVHQGLFDASMHTTVDVLDRMAVIPRHYEATGLDVNPQIIKKLHNQRHKPVVQKTIDTLKIIEKEEIDHVRKGDR
ncbi:MAG: ferritin-like domain-containing protein, partial [Sulfurovum sp.]|nr:ferritin-like domain-containing protein [Sulfurovum sp.]